VCISTQPTLYCRSNVCVLISWHMLSTILQGVWVSLWTVSESYTLLPHDIYQKPSKYTTRELFNYQLILPTTKINVLGFDSRQTQGHFLVYRLTVGPVSFLLNGERRGIFLVREAEHTPHLVSRLRIGGTITPLHLTPSKECWLRKHRENMRYYI